MIRKPTLSNRWLAVCTAAFVFLVTFGHRSVFISPGNPPVSYNSDEMEMHEASVGQALGTVPQRLIWPGGLMRHFVMAHLGVSWLADKSSPKTPDGFATHIGKDLLEPYNALVWMRLLSALVASLGFALPAYMAVRLGVPVAWVAAVLIAGSAFHLHLIHGAMSTPDGLAWGLLLVALSVGWYGDRSLWYCFAGAAIAGLAVGSKMTVLPMLPAIALFAITRGSPVMRSMAAWSTGLLLGLLVANPFYLADPFRVIKTMLGVIKFKDGECAGAMTAMRLLAAGVPSWLISLGALALGVGWRRDMKISVVGVVVSAMWMIESVASSKQVVPRYFPPLGYVLLFYGVTVALPWLASRQFSLRRWVTPVAIAFALWCMAVGHHKVNADITSQRNMAQPSFAVAALLFQSPALKRVAIDSVFFVPAVWPLANPASFDDAADYLEQMHVQHRSIAPILTGFKFSPAAVRVLGGLFDEAEVNQAARLRAMAMASRGDRHYVWFFSGDDTRYSRMWNHNLVSVKESLDAGQLDAVILYQTLPSIFSNYKVQTIPSPGGPAYVVTRH